MSFFDDALNLVKNQVSDESGSPSGVMGAIGELLNNSETGGLAGLVSKLQQGGLGEAVNSWVGTGNNQSVTASALQAALGSETVQALASKVGISPEMLSTGLAQMLPNAVDQLTPNGEVPSGDLLSQGMSMLQSKLFG